MYYIERDGNPVKQVKVIDIGSWDREYKVEDLIFDTYEKALQIANLWENSVVVSYEQEELKKVA